VAVDAEVVLFFVLRVDARVCSLSDELPDTGCDIVSLVVGELDVGCRFCVPLLELAVCEQLELVGTWIDVDRVCGRSCC